MRDKRDPGESANPELRELRELQQIMKAFHGELSKLEENLRVLSAYVVRMRRRASGAGPTLH